MGKTHLADSMKCVKITNIPYSTKFSRRIIFAVFADWCRTSKIKLAKSLNSLGVWLSRILGPRNLFPRTVRSAKYLRLENLALYGILHCRDGAGRIYTHCPI